MQRFRFLLWQRDGRGSHGPNKGQIAIVVAKAYPDREEPGRGKVLAMARSRAAASRQADRRGDHDHCEDHQRRFVELNQCRPPVKGPKRKPRHRGARGLVSRTMSDAAMRPDRRNQPLGCVVTVTDWRLYTADHRHIDGVGGLAQPAKKPAIFGGPSLGRKKTPQVAAIGSYISSPEHAVSIHTQPPCKENPARGGG